MLPKVEESCPAERGYVICTTPRSGSNFLSQLLTSTGKLGRPLEYFNGPARRVLDHPDFPDDPEAQLRAITDLGATENGVYGFKLFMSQFDAVIETRWAVRLPNLSFLHLERRDVLGQALSWARAIQTGRYRSTSASTGEAFYDPEQIRNCLSRLIIEQARWRGYFAANGLNPMTIVYEDLVCDPGTVIETIGRQMTQDEAPQIDPALINLEIQRDGTSAEWRRRFVAEHADLTMPLGLDLRCIRS